MSLTNTKILIGVSGGIAAYKVPNLVRLLRKAGADVQVMMTDSAREFVTPLTFEAVSQRPVYTSLWQGGSGMIATRHIDLATWPDLVLVAPATANLLAKLAWGLANDFVTTVLSATPKPILLSPAMNPEMWENRATQENLVRLKHLGYEIIDPDEGSMACETVGVGRMPEPESLFSVIEKYLEEESALREKLSGRKVIVTAGPTREAIDPVRYLSNRSSGKMGYAIARAAVRAGAETTLISGPVSLDPVRGASMQYIETTDSLCREVLSQFADADCLIMAAAPADFTPTTISKTKIKKHSGSLPNLPLSPTVDILAKVSRSRKAHQRVVGFALETDHALANAKTKLTEKKLDLIVLNSLSDHGAGFEHDTNKLTLIHKGGKSEDWPLMSKREAAIRLIRTVARLF